MTRHFCTILLITAVAVLRVAKAIDADAVRQSLQGNDPTAQRQALKLLARDVQGAISGTPGQSTSDVLASARERMEPFKTDILALTTSSDPKVRAMVAYLLPLVPQGPDVEDSLVKLADDADQEVIASAVASLAAVPQLSNEANNVILKVIKAKPSVMAFRFATEVAVNNQMDEAIPIVAGALSDDNPIMQVEAAKSLGRFGSKASSQLEALKHVESQSENEAVKAAMQSAIQAIKESP